MAPADPEQPLSEAIDSELFHHQLGQGTVIIESPSKQLDPYLAKLLGYLSPDYEEPEGLTDLQAVGVSQGQAIEQSGLTMQLMAILNSPRLAAQLVNHLIGDEDAEKVAPILGVSADDFTAWREGQPLTVDPQRLILISQALAFTQAGHTSSGLVFMFHNPLPQLGKRSIVEAMDSGEEDASENILRFCRRGRTQ